MFLFEEGVKFPDPFFPFHNYFFSIVALLGCGLNRTALGYLLRKVLFLIDSSSHRKCIFVLALCGKALIAEQ